MHHTFAFYEGHMQHHWHICYVMQSLRGLETHQSAAAAVAFGPQDSVLYSSSLPNTNLIEFDPEHDKVLRKFGLPFPARALCISSCGTMIAFAATSGSLGLLRYQEGNTIMLPGMTSPCEI